MRLRPLAISGGALTAVVLLPLIVAFAAAGRPDVARGLLLGLLLGLLNGLLLARKLARALEEGGQGPGPFPPMSNVAMVIPGGIRHPSGHVAATRAEVGGVSPHPLSGLSSSLGEHTYWCWGKPCHLRGFLGLEVNVDTFAMTILVLAIILALALWVRLHLSEER